MLRRTPAKVRHLPCAALFFIALPHMIASAQPQSVQAESCPNLRVNVVGSAGTEHSSVCEAARYAITRLHQCMISQRRPITIELRDVVRDPFGTQIFGRLDPRDDVVFLTKTDRLQPLVQETPYRTFPPAEFHRSLVVHEVVHAVMSQNYRRSPDSRAAWEYPAYAIQLESVASEARAAFLAVTSREPAGQLLFNDVILGADPYLFAAFAYHHLASSDGGCAGLHKLLDGQAHFIAVLHY